MGLCPAVCDFVDHKVAEQGKVQLHCWMPVFEVLHMIEMYIIISFAVLERLERNPVLHVTLFPCAGAGPHHTLQVCKQVLRALIITLADAVSALTIGCVVKVIQRRNEDVILSTVTMHQVFEQEAQQRNVNVQEEPS